MKTIELEWFGEAEMAWNRDDPHNYEDEAYFDKEKEEIFFIPLPKFKERIGEEEFNRLNTRIKNNPERFIKIEPIHHFEHHDIFNDYLNELEGEKFVKAHTFNTESIHGFKEDLLKYCSQETYEEIWHGWKEYHNKALKRKAEEWFAEHGYEVEWI